MSKAFYFADEHFDTLSIISKTHRTAPRQKYIGSLILGWTGKKLTQIFHSPVI